MDQTVWPDRRVIVDSVMRASTSVGKVNKTYLALPKTVASLTDARLFEERGIGLFTFDQRNIEEALPARFFQIVDLVEQQVEKTQVARLEIELRELRAELSFLGQTVRQLEEQLASSKPMTVPEPIETLGPADSGRHGQVVDDLPRLFAGNPWVQVLSRRGREEVTIVS